MEKFIPYEKLSKKEKHRRDAMQRGTWGVLNPVTRKSPNPKAYNRKKARKWMEDPYTVSFLYAEKISPGRWPGDIKEMTAYFMKVPSIICCR